MKPTFITFIGSALAIAGAFFFNTHASSAGPPHALISGFEAHPGRLMVIPRQVGEPSNGHRARLNPTPFHATRRATVLREYPDIDGVQVLGLRPGADLRGEIAAYQASGLFEVVEPDYVYRPVGSRIAPTDPNFGVLWGLANTGQGGPQTGWDVATGLAGWDINATNAWDVEHDASGVVVAVIDTGVDYTHPDLVSNMWVNTAETPGDGIDNDRNGFVDDVHGIDSIVNSGDPMPGSTEDEAHGTHCAGTIGAVANNGIGINGVAWGVKIMALRFLGPDGGYSSDAIQCCNYAAKMGADITSNSWGGGGRSASLQRAIKKLYKKGILFIAAAGNEATDNDAHPNYPSCYTVPNIVSVAAARRDGAMAEFSNYGARTVDLCAPGVAILSCVHYATAIGSAADGYYDLYDGTSMATPHVAGIAALMRKRFPSEDPKSFVNRLLRSTRDPHQLPGGTLTWGGTVMAAGMPDIAGAFTSSTPDPTFSSFKSTENKVSIPDGLGDPTDTNSSAAFGPEATSTLNVSASGTIAQVRLSLKVKHSYSGDLRIKLTSPSGTQRFVAYLTGGDKNNFILKSLPLGVFEGEALNGNWVLTADDGWMRDTGKILRWQLDVATE